MALNQKDLDSHTLTLSVLVSSSYTKEDKSIYITGSLWRLREKYVWTVQLCICHSALIFIEHICVPSTALGT